MSAKYKSPSFLLPNELNTSANTANDTGINSLYSMDFNGSNYIDTGFVPANNLTLNCSISAWVNMPAISNNTSSSILGTYEFTNGRSRFFLRITRTSNIYKYFFGLGSGTGYIQDFSVTISNFSPNTWVHLALTYDGADVKLYSNGTLDGTLNAGNVGSYPPLNASFSGNTYIGATHRTVGTSDPTSSVEAYLTGKIDEVAIFNKALTSTEIAALYDGTGSNIRPSNLMATSLNPIAYYPLGEQAQNTGKLPEATANVWQFPNGVLQDYVMDFDGNSKINCGPAKAYNIVTLSAWVKPDSPATYDGIFGTRNGSSVDFPYQLTNFGGKFRFIADGNTSILSNNNFNSGVWYHVMGIADGTNLKMYVDGQLQSATASYSTPLPTPNNDLMIGAQWNTDTQYEWSGEISNVAIWNTDQSANVANIYNNGSPQTSYTVTPQNWWKLNADSVYTPSAPNYTTALDYNGTSDFIDITQSGTLPPNSGDFTYSSWVNIDPSTSINIIVLLNKGDAWPGNGILIRYRSYFEVLMNGVVYGFTGLSAVDGPGVWRHFALVFDETANTLTAYVDTNKQVLSATTTLNVSDANFIIGKRQNNIQYFKGKMSNLAVYSSALSDSQISTLFNFGTPEITPSFSPAAWWKLDNTTTGIQDSSGNGNNGTNNGTTQLSTSVAFVPSWKIPTALAIPSINYTKSLEFDGTSGDYISFGNQSAFQPSSNYTFSIWFKYNSSSSIGIFSTNSSVSSVGGVLAYISGGTTIIYYHASSALFITGIPSTNEWINLTVTWSASTGIVRSFINGKYKSQLTGKTSMTWGNDLIVGKYKDSSMYFDGELSNFAMWDATLTDGFSGTPTAGDVAGGQVAEVYNLGQPQASITGSPVGWWKLDDQNTITDYSGNNYTGTNNGAVDASGDVTTSDFNIPVNGVSTTLPSTALQQSDLQFDSPYSNYSLSFDGSDYIDTGESILHSSSVTKFTISTWIKVTNINNPFGVIIGDAPGTDPTNGGFWLAYDDRNSTHSPVEGISYNIKTSTGFQRGKSSNNVISANVWTHIALVLDGQATLYVNGVSSTNRTIDNSGTLSTQSNELIIASDDTNSYGFIGKIDETSIFNYSLSEAQVLEIYNNSKPSNLNNFSGTTPISWWRLGENAYFDNNTFTAPNSITGAPNGIGAGTVTSMISADAPGTYANGIGTNLDIVDRVGDAALSIANSQSYNMIPDDKIPYVPGYVGTQTTNAFEMAFDGINDYFNIGTNIDVTGNKTFSFWIKRDANAPANDGGILSIVPTGATSDFIDLAIFQDQIQGVAANGGGANKRVATTISKNVWVHITVIKNSSAITNIYINGVNQALTSGGGWSYGAINTPRHQIGTSAGYYYTGLIDEVAIFDKALTADQIKFDLYNATTTGKTADIANNPNLPTPVAWYRMGD